MTHRRRAQRPAIPSRRRETSRPPRPTILPRWVGRVWLLATLGFLGCATIGGERGQPLVPSQYQTRTGPFTVFTSAPIAPDAPAIRSLHALERDVDATLGVRVEGPDAPVEVYVLGDREKFTHFLTFHYPELPPRRAFFIAQGSRRVIYTYMNDRLNEDLRHEATHALLHVVVGDLPLWLDEGLAEYFEGPEGQGGLNPEHLARLPDDLKAGWRPDLVRLETVKSVREMTPRDYRESWAWVHFLLDDAGPGKAALLGYLADVRAGRAEVAGLAERLGDEPASGRKMLAHLDRVRSAPVRPPAPVASRPTSAEPTILLQDAAIEPAASARAGSRRSAFGRFLGLIGLGGRGF